MKKWGWTCIFAIIGVLAIGYTGFASYQLFFYSRLQVTRQATISEWKVLEKSSSKYLIMVNYGYTYKKKGYSGEHTFKKLVFVNPSAALSHIEQAKKEKWSAFIDPKKPERSTLQKLFPFKPCIHSLLLITLYIYTLWLKAYVRHQNKVMG